MGDDFTFPANSQPHFIGSPPLWRHLADSGQNSDEQEEEEEEEDRQKSNMSLRQEFKASSNSTDRKHNSLKDDEDKMDVLWEDLNEEFSTNSGKFSQNADASSSPVQVRCIKAMKLSKANGNRKKSNILVLIAIVRRAFAIHNSRRSNKKIAW
ncbi:hypothetical protein F511_03346 [Dorcoceras hygrometricum]|uniref:Uncharacterized protein n=1 Tax=Dorcoceras hygrometricum TaxID=472368 RepID=A0A2Z7BFP4_9LAMI|nr:hypothetical protein F511_03346 [Dorcoceras hygrometricum]